MFHFSKLTGALVAAALMVGISTANVSASTLVPGSTNISPDMTYAYTENFASGSGADSRSFDLTALANLLLNGQTSTLEFSGKFIGLTVTWDSVLLVLTTPIAGIRSALLPETAFSGGDLKSLVISWTNVQGLSCSSKKPKVCTGDGTINVQLTTSAVPVPAAGLMLMAGLGGLGALRRRGKKA